MIKNITILTGFLGAGKSTLLNTIMATHNNIHYAITENEFVQESIDSELVMAHTGNTIELNHSYLCCLLSGALIDALDILIRRPTD